MIQITGDILKSAVAFAIKQATDFEEDDFKIYKERTIQDLQKPCFFVWQVTVEQTKSLGNRYERIHEMEIRFHATDYKADLYDYLGYIAEKLADTLRYINVPYDQENLVRGTDINYNIQDDVLIFNINYKILSMDAITHESMEDLETTII